MKNTVFDLEYEILKEHSKRQVRKIGGWVGNDRRRFAQLMELFLHGEPRVTQRSAWAISYCIELHPRLAGHYLSAMLKKMQEIGVHVAVPRNILRILRIVDIPRSLLGIVVTLCFKYLLDPKSPIAIKAYAMTILVNAALKEPDLAHEIEETISHIPNASPGIQACARKELKRLKKIK